MTLNNHHRLILTCALSILTNGLITGCNAPAVDPGSVPTGSPTTSNPTPTSPSGGTTLDPQEAAFVVLINQYRVSSGLAALEVSIALTESSQWMSVDMAANDSFSHTDSLGRDPYARMAAFGYDDYSSAGENIAAGYADAQSTFTQWQESPPHNANMLDASYAMIGVGRAYGASSTYGWYWTTDFGSSLEQSY